MKTHVEDAVRADHAVQGVFADHAAHPAASRRRALFVDLDAERVVNVQQSRDFRRRDPLSAEHVQQGGFWVARRLHLRGDGGEQFIRSPDIPRVHEYRELSHDCVQAWKPLSDHAT